MAHKNEEKKAKKYQSYLREFIYIKKRNHQLGFEYAKSKDRKKED